MFSSVTLSVTLIVVVELSIALLRVVRTVLTPWSIAGLPGKSACVKVGPPLFCNGPKSGS